MTDEKIIDLFWERDENAICETSAKYGKLCFFISRNILSGTEDSEEVVNDTYLAVWNAIPEKRPAQFSVFLSRIVRNLALKKHEYNSAEKRNSNAVCSLEELNDCISGSTSIENELEHKRTEQAISRFLRNQSEEKRNIFIRRYWYFESVQGISKATGFSESKVKSILFHLRKKLRLFLEQEGIEV